MLGQAPTTALSSVQIPVPSGPYEGYFIRINLGGTQYEVQTPAQVQADLGLPNPVAGNASEYVRVNAAGTAFETRSASQTQSDLGLPAPSVGTELEYLQINSIGDGYRVVTHAQVQTDVGLPAPAAGNATDYVRINAAGSAFEARTFAQVQTDIGLPNPAVGNELDFIRINGTGTAFEARTPAQVLSDIGAGNASNIASGTLASARLPAFGSGDVSFAAAGGAGTIANNAVTNTKAAQMAADTLKGNNTGSTANAADLTVAQAQTLLGLPNPAGGNELDYVRINSGGTAFEARTPAQVVTDLGLSTQVVRSYLAGLTLSNDGTSPNTVLDIAAGVAADSTNAVMMTLGAFTKSTAGAWASGSGSNGMGNGLTIAANTWYDVILANNGGTPDVYFDTSVAGANRPSGISDTKVRRIGSFLTNSSSNIIAFSQKGDRFVWATPVLDLNTSAPPVTNTLVTLTVPQGVVVYAVIALRETGGGLSSGEISVWPTNTSSSAV